MGAYCVSGGRCQKWSRARWVPECICELSSRKSIVFPISIFCGIHTEVIHQNKAIFPSLRTWISHRRAFRSHQAENKVFDGNENYLVRQFSFSSNRKWAVWWERKSPARGIFALIKQYTCCLMGTAITRVCDSRSRQTGNRLFDGNKNSLLRQFSFSSNRKQTVWWEQ